MRILTFIICLGLFFSSESVNAQDQITVKATSSVQPNVAITVNSIFSEELNPYHLSEYFRDKNTGLTVKNDWNQHKVTNPNAKPFGMDPVLQDNNFKNANRLISTSFEGIPYTGVNPADPCIAVGPNHVIQVANSQQGSVIAVYDKDGNELTPPSLLSNNTGIIGGGDPTVFYDQITKRWVYMEMNHRRDMLILAISMNGDPYGAFHLFTFPTITPPDYPKISSWGDSYVITSHEDPLGLYIINKDMANNGNPETPMFTFTLMGWPDLQFYSAAPVHVNGTLPPPSNSAPMVMRLVDDGWSPTIGNDKLEIWSFDIDWDDPNNSVFAGPTVINVADFDTDLCGYNAYACVPQPGTNLKLDPVKEILMHRVNYRNFGTHESIVLTHTVDVDGNDKAGIRWYELKKEGQNWELHQQGTYSPDNESRFMGTINMNEKGDILLAYNVSGNNTYPSIRYTGREADDRLGDMTAIETTLMEGRGSLGSNRWGDYNVMEVDPVDNNSFWFNAMYMPSNEWSTRIGHARFQDPADSPLSIQLVDFSSTTDNTAIHVKWETQNAVGFVGFELWRRSEKGNNFEKRAFISYEENPELVRKFKYRDDKVNPNELYYYKLKMIDEAGDHFWSDVIIDKIESDGTLPVTVFPNPTNSQIFIEVDKSIDRRDIHVELYNVVGKKVETKLNGNTTFMSIDLESLRSGIYIIRVFQRDKLIHLDRISKI